MQRTSAQGSFDLFISYKHKDSEAFAADLSQELRRRGIEVWIDNDQMHPGNSLLKSIEDGLSSSIDAMVILSRNYFEGWSEFERRAIYNLMVSDRLRIIPVWFQLRHADIMNLAPMFADIIAIEVADGSPSSVQAVCAKTEKSYSPFQRRSRLFELFFRCVAKKFPEDSDIALWLALFHSDLDGLRAAVERGADVNITDGSLWNRYNRSTLEECWPEWRKLFLYLSSTGAIGYSKGASDEGA